MTLEKIGETVLNLAERDGGNSRNTEEFEMFIEKDGIVRNHRENHREKGYKNHGETYDSIEEFFENFTEEFKKEPMGKGRSNFEEMIIEKGPGREMTFHRDYGGNYYHGGGTTGVVLGGFALIIAIAALIVGIVALVKNRKPQAMNTMYFDQETGQWTYTPHNSQTNSVKLEKTETLEEVAENSEN